MIFPKVRWIFASLVVLALLLTACAGQQTAAPPTPTEAPEMVDTPAPLPTDTPAPEEAMESPVEEEESAGPEVNRVEVGLTEFEINMPDTLPPGPTMFEVTNNGSFVHNLAIEGQGIDELFETDLQPGESQTMEVDLQPGTYQVYCPVGNHAEQGMRLELTVSEQ